MLNYARNYRKYIHVATDYVVLTSAHGEAAKQPAEPVLLVAVAKRFLATFARMRGYGSLDAFLSNYKAEDVHCLPGAAEQESALMYSYCEHTKSVYVPKSRPEGSLEALCLLQGELMERDKVGVFATPRM